MSTNNIVEINSQQSIEESKSNLLEAFHKPGKFEQLLPTKARLHGEVVDSHVRAYRIRGNKRWYLHFEGQLIKYDGGSTLKGTIVAKNQLFLLIIVNFLIFFAAIAFFSPIIWWKGVDSVWQMVLGVLIALVAATAYKLYHINMKAEADLLRKDLERAMLIEGV